VRPLLNLTKARLIATLAALGMSFADDPSNRDTRFTRPRLRNLMPALAAEGLDAGRFVQLAHRLRRADAAIEIAVNAAAMAVSEGAWDDRGQILLNARKFAALPAEIALRLLGRAIAHAGDEGPVELGKLETLFQALMAAEPAASRLRRTLAGAMVTLSGDTLAIALAPPRSSQSRRGRKALTTRQHHASGASRRR
jgi:tRNA(Ile)-lysidine synthase